MGSNGRLDPVFASKPIANVKDIYAINILNKEIMMTIIPKDKPQLLSLLNKQTAITVLALHEGKPSEVAEQLKAIKQGRVTVIVLKS